METQEENTIQPSFPQANEQSADDRNADSRHETVLQSCKEAGSVNDREGSFSEDTEEVRPDIKDPRPEEAVAESVEDSRDEPASVQTDPGEMHEGSSEDDVKEPAATQSETEKVEETGSEKKENISVDPDFPVRSEEMFMTSDGYLPEMPMNFIPYNTDMEQLQLPEYGRKIQELIQYCKTIPDREERTACAYAISDVMARLFPGVLGEKGDRKKIWDHMNIMAGFELDIDFPVEVLTREQLNPKPEKIEFNKKPIRYRHYGRTLELMIEKAAEMEECEQKDHLILLIANQMKKQLLAHNKEGVSDAKVLKDLAEYSKGRIVLDPQTYPLHEYNEVNNKQPQAKKKRKK